MKGAIGRMIQPGLAVKLDNVGGCVTEGEGGEESNNVDECGYEDYCRERDNEFFNWKQ